MLLRNMLRFGHVQSIQEKAKFVWSTSINGYTGKIFGLVMIY